MPAEGYERRSLRSRSRPYHGSGLVAEVGLAIFVGSRRLAHDSARNPARRISEHSRHQPYHSPRGHEQPRP